MTDQELRLLVRDAVSRHLGPRAVSPPPAPAQAVASHPSHAIYLTVVNVDDACVIQPSVPCDHCGYCRSHGH